MSDHIHTMRSYFAASGHDPVTPAVFAAGMLRTKQAAIRRQMAERGFVAAELLAVLDVVLDDRTAPPERAVMAFISGGHWIAQCECGGAEYVDLESPVFCCSGCWNRADAHMWRPVTLPTRVARLAIERALLRRPREITRTWQPDDTVERLIAENVANGVEVGR